MSNHSMKALYYIALICDTEKNTETQQKQWTKANQNRLNQNFSAIENQLESLSQRISALENAANT